MHGHSKQNSCITVEASLINSPLDVTASVVNRLLAVSIKDITPKIRVTASLLCSVNKDSYLRVSPDYVWLTPDMLSGEFDIYSNVTWRIE